MNKKLLVVVLVVVLILFVGFYFMKSKKESDSLVQSGNADKSVFSSVKDALSKNISLECEFKDESGKTTKSYIKNGAVRISATDDSEAGEIIIQKEMMYMWSTKTKQGFVYPIKKEDQPETVGLNSGQAATSESYLDMIETYKDSCKVAVVADSLFEAPKDVTFQDMSSLLENLQKQIPDSN